MLGAGEIDQPKRRGDEQNRDRQHQHVIFELAFGLDHGAGENHDQDDENDFGQRFFQLADAGNLHPGGQSAVVDLGQGEDETDGDAIGEDVEHDAEQEAIDRLEHGHGELLAADAAGREQRMPGLVEIERALQEHQHGAHDGAERADQHDRC